MGKPCPNCNKELFAETTAECPACGIVFEKWVDREKRKGNAFSSNVATDKTKNPWILLVIVVIVFFLILNIFVQRKTKDLNPKDTTRLANLLALKAVGMDQTFQFLSFVKDGDIDSVKKYLDAGYSPNKRGPEGCPLELAIQLERIEMVRFLIQHGADVNGKGRNGYSMVFLALGKFRWVEGRREGGQTFKLLVEAGGKFDPSESKIPALSLQEAVQRNDLELADLLRQAGARLP